MHDLVEWFLIAVAALLVFAVAAYVSKPLGFAVSRLLAAFCQNQGWLDLALRLRGEILATAEAKFGKTHYKVAENLVGLADVHHLRKEHEKALPLYERALGMLEKRHGQNHPATLPALNSLAESQRALGRLEPALALFQRALDLTEKSLGKDHPDVALSLDNVAGIYHAQGLHDIALPLYQRAVSLSEKVLGKRHEQTLALAEHYAFCLQRLSRK
jgi:tetratricopeptide (TPR) repeat protein